MSIVFFLFFVVVFLMHQSEAYHPSIFLSSNFSLEVADL